MITFENIGGHMAELHSYEFNYDDIGSGGDGEDERLSNYNEQWAALKRNPNRTKLFAMSGRNYDYQDSLGGVSSDLDTTVKYLQSTDPLCQNKTYYEIMKIAFCKYPDLRTAYYSKLNAREIS